MERKIYDKKEIDKDDDFGFLKEQRSGRGDGMKISERGNKGRGTGNGFGRSDKGRGNHLNGGRRDGDGPHQEEGCNIVKKSTKTLEKTDSNLK